VGLTEYAETVTSLLYPGNTLSEQVLHPAVWALETALNLPPWQRQCLCLRLDGGFGTDANLNWALRQGYGLVAKNKGGRRAGAWGRRAQDWTELEPDQRWVALAPEQLSLAGPTRTLALRWRNQRGQLKHALYVVTDLDSSLELICQKYNLRGGTEVEIRNDKQGLLLAHRRKRAWPAQEILVLLNDLAHNFITAFRRMVLTDTPLAEFGPYRLIQEVFNIPGEVVMRDERLVELRLLETHPYARIMAEALPRLWR
jgi:hypothetical protein